MIKKTLYFGNPVYLSLKNAQLMIKLPEVVRNDTLPENFKRTSEVTKPIEDIGVVVLDHKQITISSGVLEALLENNCAVITCNSKKYAGWFDASSVWEHDAKRKIPATVRCLSTVKETALAADHKDED